MKKRNKRLETTFYETVLSCEPPMNIDEEDEPPMNIDEEDEGALSSDTM